MRALEETLIQRVKNRAERERRYCAEQIAHYQTDAAASDLLERIAAAIEAGAPISPDDLLWLATGPAPLSGFLGDPNAEHQRLRTIAEKMGVSA